MTSISFLPTEILRHIFSLLNSIDLCNISQVCKSWRVLSLDPMLWKDLYFSGTSASQLRLCLRCKLSKHTQSLTVRVGGNKFTGQKGHQSVFTKANSALIRDYAPNVSELILICNVKSESASNLLNDAFLPPNLQRLTLININLYPTDFRNSAFKFLTYLKIVGSSLREYNNNDFVWH